MSLTKYEKAKRRGKASRAEAMAENKLMIDETIALCKKQYESDKNREVCFYPSDIWGRLGNG